MSRHHQEKFDSISSRQHFFIHFKKLIFLKNNCFRVSHMGCEALFWAWWYFWAFPNYISSLEHQFWIVQQLFSRGSAIFKKVVVETLKFQISAFESYTLLRRIQNENQLDVGIQCFVPWAWFLCSKKIFPFFTSIWPGSQTNEF